MVNHIRFKRDVPDLLKQIRIKREQSNSVELFDVENSDQCWVTGWGDTNGKYNYYLLTMYFLSSSFPDL